MSEGMSPKEKQAYSISLIVIVPFVGYFGFSLFFLGVESTKEMTALLGGYVATVLVYYFGEKQAQVLSKQVKDTEDQKEQVKQQLESLKLQLLPGLESEVNDIRNKHREVELREQQFKEIQEKLKAMLGE